MLSDMKLARTSALAVWVRYWNVLRWFDQTVGSPARATCCANSKRTSEVCKITFSMMYCRIGSCGR